jgi:high-affinity iron transporter
VLFLQAIVLEAGAGIVLIGVAIGLRATPAVGYLTIRLQRKLPHKKMLVATGARRRRAILDKPLTETAS